MLYSYKGVMHLLVIVQLAYIESLKEYQNLEKSSVMSSVTCKSSVFSKETKKIWGFNEEVKG